MNAENAKHRSIKIQTINQCCASHWKLKGNKDYSLFENKQVGVILFLRNVYPGVHPCANVKSCPYFNC